MEPSEWQERFSRQTILPSVGEAGQRKWAQARVGLVGGGAVREAAVTALTSSGLTQLSLWDPASEPPADWDGLTALLVLTTDEDARRRWNRALRAKPLRALFGWNAGTGTGLFLPRFGPAGCPCFECFEVLNPKAFNPRPASEAERLLGALAASELLLWILKEESPVDGKVWITSLDSGMSVHHPVFPSPKCPAGLLARGAKVTP